MSTILNALRRIEAEEERRQRKDLATSGPEALVALGTPTKRRARRLVGVLLAILAATVLGAAGTVVLLEVAEGRVLFASAPTSSTLSAVSSAIPSQLEAKPEVSVEKTTVVVDSEAALRNRNNLRPAASAGASEALEPEGSIASAFESPPIETPIAEKIVAEPVRETAMEFAMVERDFSSRPDPSLVPEPVVEERISEVRELEETIVVERERAEPPTVVRPPVPSLSIKRTVWHPRPERREAMVEIFEGEETRIVRLREGEFLGPLELQEVRPTGVTFLHDGIEVQRRVGQP